MSEGPIPRAHRVNVALKVRLKLADRDAFEERLSKNISQTGIFIRSRNPAAPGTRVRFEYTTEDDARIMRGIGIVRWTRSPDASQTADAPPGMGIEFVDLDPQTEELITRIVARYGAGERAPQRRDQPRTSTMPDAAPRPAAHPVAPLDPEEQSALESLVSDAPGAEGAEDDQPPYESDQTPYDDDQTPYDAVSVPEAEAGAMPAAADAIPPEADQIAWDLSAAPVPASTVDMRPTASRAECPLVLDLAGAAAASAVAGEHRTGENRIPLVIDAEGNPALEGDGLAIADLTGWLDARWPAVGPRTQAERLGLDVLEGADGDIVIQAGAQLLQPAELLGPFLDLLLEPYPAEQRLLGATVIVPSGASPAALETLEQLLQHRQVFVARFVQSGTTITQTLPHSGPAAIGVELGEHSTRVVLVDATGELVSAATHPDVSIFEAEANIAEGATLALLREHGIDPGDSPALQRDLERQIRRQRQQWGHDGPWCLKLAGADVALTRGWLTQRGQAVAQRLAMHLERLQRADERDWQTAPLLITSEGRVWPGLLETLENLLERAPQLVEMDAWTRIDTTLGDASHNAHTS